MPNKRVKQQEETCFYVRNQEKFSQVKNSNRSQEQLPPARDGVPYICQGSILKP